MKNLLRKKYLFIILFFFFCGCVPPPERKKDAAMQVVSVPVNAAYHYSLSVHLALNGNLDDAIAELEKALSFDSKSSFLAMELAILYSEKGYYQKAISLCEKSLVENGSDVDTRLLLAGLYMNTKNHKEALREYNKASEMDPQNITFHLYAGILHGEAGNYEKALASFRSLLAIDPDNLMGNYYIARTLTELKQYGEAEEKYRSAIAIRPIFEQAIIELTGLYEKQGRNDLAIETYRNYIKLNHHSVNVRLKLANLLLKIKRLEEAERELKEALEWGSENREVNYTLGLFYLEKDQYDKAIEIFTVLLKSYPDDYRLRYLLASAYEGKKDYFEAIAELKKIPGDSDLYPNARVSISIIMKNSGGLAEAIDNLLLAIETRKDAPDFYIILSSLYEEKKELLKAEEILKKGIQVSQSAQLHYSLGVLYEKTGRFDESVREMRMVIQLDSDNADAMNFIGYTFADKGINLEEAEALIKQALGLRPGNGYMLDSLGWLYFRQNKTEQAIKHLKEAAAVLPGDATITEHLGDAYAKSGQIAEAIETYRKAMELNRENKAVQQKIDHLTTKNRER